MGSILRLIMHHTGARMINVLLVFTYYSNGGPTQVIKSLVTGSDNNRVRFWLVTLRNKNIAESLEADRKYFQDVYELNYLSNLDVLAKSAKQINAIIKDNDIDIVHSHGFIPDIISCLLPKKVKRISTLHNRPNEDYVNMHGKVLGSIMSFVHFKALNHIHLCIACSRSASSAFERKIKRIGYVQNGISPVESSLKAEVFSKIPDESKIFLYAGRLTNGKNVLTMISRFKESRKKDEYLLVLGNGPLSNECHKLAEDNVMILGHQNISNFLPYCDFYISFSLSEGFSISVLQALSVGLGLVVSNISSHMEVFEDAGSIPIGVSFSDDNFSEQFARLRGMYKEIDKNLIRSFFLSNYTNTIMAEKYAIAYESVLNNEIETWLSEIRK